MKKHLIVFFILAILISGFYPIFAQEKQKIPEDFLDGRRGGHNKVALNEDRKWTGRFDKQDFFAHLGMGASRVMNVEVKLTFIESSSQHHGETSFVGEARVRIDKPIYEMTYTSPPLLQVTWKFNPTEVVCPIDGKINRTEKKFWIWFRGGKQVDYEAISKAKGFVLSHEKHKLSAFDLIMCAGTVSNEGDILFQNEKETDQYGSFSGNLEIKDDQIIFSSKYEYNIPGIYIERKTTLHQSETMVGELYRIYTKKDTLGKTVQINEPIKTDEYTQRDIAIPAVPEMPDFPYKIGDLIVAGNTECVFTSENELYLISGEVISFLDKNWWESVDLDKVVSNEYEISDIEMGELITKVEKLREEGYGFKVRSPQAVIAVRGTQFITKVEKDGATTLTVLDGEVEFSDMEKRKTVLVKKNQRSVVKPGGLPTEPEAIEQNQILKWWK